MLTVDIFCHLISGQITFDVYVHPGLWRLNCRIKYYVKHYTECFREMSTLMTNSGSSPQHMIVDETCTNPNMGEFMIVVLLGFILVAVLVRVVAFLMSAVKVAIEPLILCCGVYMIIFQPSNGFHSKMIRQH